MNMTTALNQNELRVYMRTSSWINHLRTFFE